MFADALVLLKPGYCRHSFPDIADLTATRPRALFALPWGRQGLRPDCTLFARRFSVRGVIAPLDRAIQYSGMAMVE
ncbi:hypothetical protein [Bradyrhizobium zhanjiangense]|uniref:hypothetical protein n=1 Tax=Bradyrhizobium zhanjiangense TaxID=1325107 RepID=UPI0013E8B6E2|nr:hypothetical protein [Bradyrhizobium zhanjiangense]